MTTEGVSVAMTTEGGVIAKLTMANRKVKFSPTMACTLSVQDYLSFFLTKPHEGNGVTVERKDKTTATPQGSLLLATVHKYEKGGGEMLFYSKRIQGGKQIEPISLFVQDMTGNADNHLNNGNLIRTNSLMKLEMENESELAHNSSISVDLLCSRSPSKIAAEQLLQFLDYCKRNSTRATIRITFGHPFSWDNKYNKQGIQKLHERGVKLKALNFQQAINMMLNDVYDNLESLDELQTCRGTICMDFYMLKRAMAKFRDALLPTNDHYYQENEEKLKEILGSKKPHPSKQYHKQSKLTSFSLATYRDYFFLQNTEEIWAKLRVSLSKIKQGLIEEELLFEELYNTDEPSLEKKIRKDKSPLNKNELQELMHRTWIKVADGITLNELAVYDDIIVNITVVVSEYPDRMEWHSSIQTLHRHLVEKLYHTGMKKIRVESAIRYAMNISCGSDSISEKSSVQSQQSSKVEADRDHLILAPECMHIQDILFDMLEDLEDNLICLGKVNFDRGVNITVQKPTLSSGMSLLNKAITIRTEDGCNHSMNSDFIDVYAESF